MCCSSRFFVGLACFLLCASTGCGNPDAKQAKLIMEMPAGERRQALHSLPPDKEVAIYLYAATKIEPPKLLMETAADWERILPTVKERLLTEKDDLARFQLLWLLVNISENYCLVSSHTDLVDAAKKAVAEMGPYKNAAQEPLNRILTRSAKPLPVCD